MTEFFEGVEPIRYEGPESDDPLTFRWYDADRQVAGSVHGETSCGSRPATGTPSRGTASTSSETARWTGRGTDRSGRRSDGGGGAEDGRRVRVLLQARCPFWSLPRLDIAPEGPTFAESARNLDQMVGPRRRVPGAHRDRAAVGHGQRCSRTGGSWPARRRTRIPRCSRYAAGQVAHCMNVTHRLGGSNYVLWGGREGYETLLNTDMRRELAPAGPVHEPRRRAQVRHRVRGHASSSSRSPWSRRSTSTTTTSPRCTPSCRSTASRTRSRSTSRSTTPPCPATTSHHEVATAVNTGIFGSIDANAGDDRLGWDLDRFPVSVEQMTLGMLEILRGGGFTTGGLMFDASCAASPIVRDDLFIAHIGGMDIMARALARRGVDHRDGRAGRLPRRAVRGLGHRARS